MGVFIAFALSLALICATVLIHYEVFRWIPRLIPHPTARFRGRVLVAISGIFFAHLVEICLYALAFFMMERYLGFGAIAGEGSGGWLDFFYFSAGTYTTLGVGDIVPTGLMRVVAGIESLNGLVLIAWSASYTYVAIEGSWERLDGPATPS